MTSENPTFNTSTSEDDHSKLNEQSDPMNASPPPPEDSDDEDAIDLMNEEEHENEQDQESAASQGGYSDHDHEEESHDADINNFDEPEVEHLHYGQHSHVQQQHEEYYEEDDETGDDEPQVEMVPNHMIRATVNSGSPLPPQTGSTHAPSRRDSTKVLLASHDASIASHRQKLQEHKRWLEEQRMNMPNMKEAPINRHSPLSHQTWTVSAASSSPSAQSPFQHHGGYNPHQSHYHNEDDNDEQASYHSDEDYENNHDDQYSFDENNDQYSNTHDSEGDEDHEPIESILLKKGKQSEEYKQQLQRNHQLHEQTIHTFSPKISRDPENYHKPGDRIEERLFELGKEREGRLEQQRQQHMSQYKFKPEVSENSRNLVPQRPDILEVEQRWSEMKSQKLTTARDVRQQEEMRNLRETPQLSDRTMKLLRSINYRFPNQSIPDYHAAKELERAGKIQSLQEEHMRKTMRDKPTISQLSKKLVKKLEREGSVSDRLYQESFKRNMEREMRAREAATAAEERDSLSTNDERRYTFRPDQSGNRAYSFSDTESISTNASNRNIYQDLVRKGRDIEMKRQMQMEFLAAKEKQLHNKSKINPVSAEIASRLPTSSKDRLYSYNRKKKSIEEHNEEFTFKPKINDKSREMIRDYDYQTGTSSSPRGGDSSTRIERLYSMDQRKRERIKTLQKHYEQLEISECTFKPDLKKTKKYMKSYYGFASGVSPRNGDNGVVFSYSQENNFVSADDDLTEYSALEDGSTAGGEKSQFYGLSFHKRAEQWHRKREKKRQEAELMARNSELRECTFSPKTISKETPVTSLITSPRTSLGSPRAVLQDDGNPLGYGQFVHRQREARRRKQEVEQRQNRSPGNTWKNRVTQPQPFKLGKERTNKTPVKSLQKALSPPTFKKHVQKVQGAHANDYLLDDDDDDARHKPSPLRTDGIPRQGLFSTRSSIQILDSMGGSSQMSPSQLGRKPSLLEDSIEIDDDM
uniref:Uncharacterized protein n=1 Tax=Percolomonas cosmopolitus TaxID=63605 RepID=A0A7S1KPF8_9EUKA|mmetsp:Transcript_1656/g.5763  ORF Transcript_1656/g.5763 Transcript_1656/m.5763 type:complete len:979 (+) Transcript_1656:1849-4785(+)